MQSWKKSNCCPEKKCLLRNQWISGLIGIGVLRIEARHHWKLQTRLTRRIHRSDRNFSPLRVQISVVDIVQRDRDNDFCFVVVPLLTPYLYEFLGYDDIDGAVDIDREAIFLECFGNNSNDQQFPGVDDPHASIFKLSFYVILTPCM